MGYKGDIIILIREIQSNISNCLSKIWVYRMGNQECRKLSPTQILEYYVHSISATPAAPYATKGISREGGYL